MREIGYVLKAYPRASEPFILSEIHRLEEAGVPVRLFAIKPAEAYDQLPRHPVVDRIRARPIFLPKTTSLSKSTCVGWLRENHAAFRSAVVRVLRRRPGGLARATAAILAQAARTRRSPWAGSEQRYIREFLLAIDLADRLLGVPEVGHLHAHYAHSTATVTWLAAMILGLPFSFTGHARDIYCESLNPAGLLGRKLRAARFAVTCSEANREILLALAGDTPVHRLYHGLNADFARLLLTAVDEPPAPAVLHVLGVGRLVAKKGFDVLVDAAALVRRAGIPLEVTLVGPEGAHAGELRRRIAEHGLEQVVRLAGPQDQRGLYAAYHRASAFCLPCRILDDGDRDGIPNVLVEAMACGRPVVTTRVSGIPELVTDGDNGLLVPPDDAGATAAALTRLWQDPALAIRLGERGRATVRERFDGHRLAGELAALFAEAVA